MKRALSSFAFTMLFVPALVFGQQSTVFTKENFSFLLGQRTWFSNGISDYHFLEPNGVPPINSHVKYDDVDSTVVEFNGDALLFKRYILSTDVGFGSISGGSDRYQDFLGDDKTTLFSEEEATVDGDDLFYVNVDLGYRIMYCCPYQFNAWDQDYEPTATIDLLIGYQHWREKYVATKGVQTKDPFGAFGFVGPFPDQGIAQTDEITWDSVRVGLRVKWNIFRKLSFRGRLIFIPWTSFELESIYPLRPSLKQDPSAKATASGGFGVQSDTTLSYNVWRGLSIEAGFQFWDIESGDGTITFRSPAADSRQPFNEANSRRWGAIIGINYLF